MPLGLPKGREKHRGGALISLLIHLLLIYLIVVPVTHHHPIHEMAQGAGGAGPSGGGGGGHGGTGGDTRRITERVDYVSVSPAATPTPAVVPPPPPKPVPVTPLVVAKPVVTPQAVSATPTIAVPSLKPLDVASNVVGVGGGSGHDGSGGNGPGSGGGNGSGVGPGRGSGNGPGTGGGTQANDSPRPIEMFLPPIPVPDNVKGFHLIAEFDVDSTGRVLSIDFTPTGNRGYNRKLDELFKTFRFRPGTTPDGTPVRMKAQLSWDLY